MRKMFNVSKSMKRRRARDEVKLAAREELRGEKQGVLVVDHRVALLDYEENVLRLLQPEERLHWVLKLHEVRRLVNEPCAPNNRAFPCPGLILLQQRRV